MRRICTFNLANHVVQDMHKQVRRGYRSAFVQNAIYEKMNRINSHSLDDYKTVHLLAHIRNFRFTSLTDLEKTLLEQMIARLEQIED